MKKGGRRRTIYPSFHRNPGLFKKILVIIAALLLLAMLALAVFLSGGPEFPAETDAIIARAIQGEPPELVHGTTGYAQSGDIKIWYEVNQAAKPFKTNPKGNVLLIMGAGTSSMLWPPEFIQELAKAGYMVVRFDNRGTGLSDWVDNWQQDNSYSLEDMAKDAIAVLDATGVKQAHVIGTSMGGMIGQRLAISHGDRVLSLVSMSSSAYIFDPALARLSTDFTLDTLRLVLKYATTGSEAGMIKMWMGIIDLMMSEGLKKNDIPDVANLVLYEMRKRRGFSQDVMMHHAAAMTASGSRLDEMGNIKCPVLVIHGTADTVLNIAHAKKYAAMIPDVETLWLQGAGHIIRDRHIPDMMGAMFKLFESARQ
jgi:pimeloyl-ACP methyl ester carboxylesterase